MEDRTQLSLEAVEAEQALELPNRELLSLVNANLALPINAALSANVLSDGAAALSSAQQNAPINQGMVGTNPLLGGH
ncbi:MAG: hypothetical protein E6I52_12135 [Chloroflexi bacterium]|nr:MAG: hypothetical protein E6I52_12135 [Chloroflexota bacterium]